jgi:hypothetical protein
MQNRIAISAAVLSSLTYRSPSSSAKHFPNDLGLYIAEAGQGDSIAAPLPRTPIPRFQDHLVLETPSAFRIILGLENAPVPMYTRWRGLRARY